MDRARNVMFRSTPIARVDTNRRCDIDASDSDMPVERRVSEIWWVVRLHAATNLQQIRLDKRLAEVILVGTGVFGLRLHVWLHRDLASRWV